MDYIDAFLFGDYASIEFFEGDTDLFGGARPVSELDTTSGESILKSFAGDNDALLKHFMSSFSGKHMNCKIRGWNNAMNADITFALR